MGCGGLEWRNGGGVFVVLYDISVVKCKSV